MYGISSFMVGSPLGVVCSSESKQRYNITWDFSDASGLKKKRGYIRGELQSFHPNRPRGGVTASSFKLGVVTASFAAFWRLGESFAIPSFEKSVLVGKGKKQVKTAQGV
ncbi:MAG: hypothetical protein IJJ26_06455 [Victivallales bacterium]|nr:hypothetical protein [Victivallales bacterium]